MLDIYLFAARNMLRRAMGASVNGEEKIQVATPARGVAGQKNYLGLMFVGLEPEAAHPSDVQGLSFEAGVVVMVYADFAEYAYSLRVLSQAMQCFQESPVLQPSTFPDLPLSAPVTVSPHFIPLEEQLRFRDPFAENSHPAMFYKLRSLRFGGTGRPTVPRVKEVDTGVGRTGH